MTLKPRSVYSWWQHNYIVRKYCEIDGGIEYEKLDDCECWRLFKREPHDQLWGREVVMVPLGPPFRHTLCKHPIPTNKAWVQHVPSKHTGPISRLCRKYFLRDSESAFEKCTTTLLTDQTIMFLLHFTDLGWKCLPNMSIWTASLLSKVFEFWVK